MSVLVVIFLTITSIASIEGPALSSVSPRQFDFRDASLPPGWVHRCLNDNQCGYGFCRAYFCRCIQGYITFHQTEVCAYDQRQKLVAFLLSFFLGQFGVDWFYLARENTRYIVTGVIKIFSICGCFSICPIVLGIAGQKSKVIVVLAAILEVAVSLVPLVWWLADWIRILTDKFVDGNGAPLQSF